MKAFVAITLLAACAAAQTFDYQTGGLRQQLLKKELGLTNGLWNKDVFNKDYTLDTLRNVDTVYNTVNHLSLDEIIRHPLFQTYYTLPLFRQHFTHPLFQVYLTTPYFQKFWTHPIFPTFFRSSHLFNKFIYPVVYNTHYPTVDTETVGDYDLGLNNIVGDYKNFPLNVNHVEYSHVMDKIFKHLIVNKPEILEVKTDVKIQTPVKETTFVKRVDPVTGEVKYVVDDYETVEKRVTPVEVINTIRKPHVVDDVYGNEHIKNILLKKIFLNKIFGDRVNIPELYNVNKYETIPRYNKYESTVLPRELLNLETVRPVVDNVYDNEIKNTLLKKIFLNKVIYGDRMDRITPDLYNLNKITYGDRVNIPEMYNLNKYESILPRHFNQIDLLNKYTRDLVYPREHMNTVYPRDFVNTVYPRYETVNNVYPTRDILNRYETVNTVLPRELTKIDLIKKIEAENKIENILKSVVV